MSDVTRVLDVRIQIRNDSAANWTTVNPTPMKGEMGIEIDTGLFKFGDGVTPWNDLPYGSNPAIQLTSPPTAADWQHLVGTMAVVNGNRMFVLVSTAVGAAVWRELATAQALSDLDEALRDLIAQSVSGLSYGDMAKSQFATNASAADGYVDKAVEAQRLSQYRSFSVNGDVVAAAIQFNGSQNVNLNAALVDIAELAGGGTFIKVKVDTKGRVVGYEALLASDIPDLTLAKITDAGTAAGKNTGTAVGQVVVVGEDGHIDASLMPSITITDVFVVESEAEMLALTADQGDVAMRTDLSTTFILAQDDPTVLTNWLEVKNPLNGIQAINGKSGAYVTLNTDDVDEGNDNLYFTEERVLDVVKAQASTVLTDGDIILRETDTLILNGGTAAGHV